MKHGLDDGAPTSGLVPGISVVVPVFNSARTLEALCQRLSDVLERQPGAYEIILVDDGSSDASWERIRELARERRTTRGLRLMRNYGQHNALLCGIRNARFGTLVTLDDDLQNPPEEIPALLEELERGVDVVYGTPQVERYGLWRDVSSRMTKLVLAKAMGAVIARQISAFRVFRTPLRDAFTQYGGSFVSIDVLLTWATTRFAAIRVRHDERRVGASHYGVRKLVTHALNLMTGFSVLPLQLASLVGFAATTLGLFVLIYVIGRTLLQGAAVPGFAFLASIIAIFSGAQLFSLGIIGEYLGRIHFRSMDQPPYVVAHTVDGSETTGGS